MEGVVATPSSVQKCPRAWWGVPIVIVLDPCAPQQALHPEDVSAELHQYSTNSMADRLLALEAWAHTRSAPSSCVPVSFETQTSLFSAYDTQLFSAGIAIVSAYNNMKATILRPGYVTCWSFQTEVYVCHSLFTQYRGTFGNIGQDDCNVVRCGIPKMLLHNLHLDNTPCVNYTLDNDYSMSVLDKYRADQMSVVRISKIHGGMQPHEFFLSELNLSTCVDLAVPILCCFLTNAPIHRYRPTVPPLVPRQSAHHGG